MASKVELSTVRYELSHGRKPRGRGHWGFCPARSYDAPDYLDHVMWHSGTYAEAKRMAQAYFGARGVVDVVVCS